MLQTLAQDITTFHDEALIAWAEKGVQHQKQDFFKLVEENHAFNFNLWNTEDRARRDDLGFEFVYRAKREIDHYNQQRNNRMEAMDNFLFNTLHPASHELCPVHSETPGMMIDRLSILSLKIYHMRQQTLRKDVDEAHRALCHEKLSFLITQRSQLSSCLHILLDEVKHQQRTFRLYRQCKMYNDPNLNPQLYNQQPA